MDQFQQLKKFIWSGVCPTQTGFVYVTGISNYGCWDGSNFWAGSFNGSIYKVSPSNLQNPTRYQSFISNGGRPLQLEWDGRYIHVGNYDTSATWFKFDPISQTTIASGRLYPGGTGAGGGGIQGVLWDGNKLWFGAPHNVKRWDVETNSVEITVTGQQNVNGLSSYTDGTGQKYILAACSDFWSKINANTGAYTTYDNLQHAVGYRICNDGTYIYVAYFTNPGRVRKFRLADGAFISTWTVGSFLNSINRNGDQLWTTGDNKNIDITNTDGYHLCTISGLGSSDVVIGGNHAWTVQHLNQFIGMTTIPQSALGVSALPSEYRLKVLDKNRNEVQELPINRTNGVVYFSGLPPSGLYILNYNGYIAAKCDFPSGVGIKNSLFVV